MDGIRIAHAPAPDYALRCVHPHGNEEPAGTYPDFAAGWAAGQRAVHADRGAAFALYRVERRIARFSGSTGSCTGRQRATSMRWQRSDVP